MYLLPQFDMMENFLCRLVYICLQGSYMVANTRFDLVPVPGGGVGRIGLLAYSFTAQRYDESLGSGAVVTRVK